VNQAAALRFGRKRSRRNEETVRKTRKDLCDESNLRGERVTVGERRDTVNPLRRSDENQSHKIKS